MTLTTLVTGATSRLRENLIASELAKSAFPGSDTALLLEGLPDGAPGSLDALLPNLAYVTRLSSGCMCCIGRLPLQVTLNRMLRRAPARLYISLADAAHVSQLRAFLSQPAYRSHLELTADLAASENVSNH